MQQIQSLISNINQLLNELAISIDAPKDSQLYSDELKKAHIYPLAAGGKRVRPLLTLLMAGAIGGEKGLQCAYQSAVAAEMVHTYTLVHDDLPCMDNDDLRRGRPTTHKVYGEAKALLVGDGLLTSAFLKLTQTEWQKGTEHTKELVEILAQAAGPGGVIWGQWLDLSLTGIDSTTWELMETVHIFKTGKLLAASLEMGFICGYSHVLQQENNSTMNSLRKKVHQAGIYIGLAFQIIDDILDGTKTSKELGKTAGKDESQNKFTALKILGEKKAQQLSEKYTSMAHSLLNEVFEQFENKENNSVNHSYQILLMEQIQNLLARSN